MAEHSIAAYAMVTQAMSDDTPVGNRRQLLQAMTEMAASGADFSGGFFVGAGKAGAAVEADKPNAFQLCLSFMPRCPAELVFDLVSLLVAVVKSVGIEVSHLTGLLRLAGDGESWPPYSSVLLHGMAEMAEGHHQGRFFVLDGNGGLYVGGDRDWAFDAGYTLDMWVWREKAGDWMDVVLYRMVAGEDARMAGRGEVVIEVLLRGGQVVLAVGNGMWRSEAVSNLDVPTCSWSRITISHTPHKLRKSEVSFRVGSSTADAALKFPSSYKYVRHYAGCFGCNVKSEADNGSFKGLLGSVRVFDEPIQPSQVPGSRLEVDMPDPTALVSAPRHSCNPGSLGMTKHDPTVLPPLVPSPLLLHTTFFGGHHPFCEALDCIGRVEALVPLLAASLTLPSEPQYAYFTSPSENPEVCQGVLALIAACIPPSHDALLARDGALLRRIVCAFGHVLSVMPRGLLTRDGCTSLSHFVSAIQDVLMRSPSTLTSQLHAVLLRNVVLHCDIWAGSAADVQIEAINMLRGVAGACGDTVRSGAGVSSVLDLFKERFPEGTCQQGEGGLDEESKEALRGSLADFCIDLVCADQSLASAAASSSAVRRFVLSSGQVPTRRHALRIASSLIVRWADQGITQAWDVGLLYVLRGERDARVAVLALECLVQHLSRAPPQEEALFASSGGYALLQDSLCSRQMPDDAQLRCFTHLMHLLVRIPPPGGDVLFSPDESQRVCNDSALQVILTFLEVCNGSVRQHALSALLAVLPSYARNRKCLTSIPCWCDMLLSLVCGIDGGVDGASPIHRPGALRMTSLPSIVTWHPYSRPGQRGANDLLVSPSRTTGGAMRRFEMVCQLLRSVVSGEAATNKGFQTAYDVLSSLSRFIVPPEMLGKGEPDFENEAESLLTSTARTILTEAVCELRARIARRSVWADVTAEERENVAGMVSAVHAFLNLRFTENARIQASKVSDDIDNMHRRPSDGRDHSSRCRQLMTHELKRRNAESTEWEDANLVREVLSCFEECVSKEDGPGPEELTRATMVPGDAPSLGTERRITPLTWPRSLWHLHCALLSEPGSTLNLDAISSSAVGLVSRCVWAASEDPELQYRASVTVALLRDSAVAAAISESASGGGGGGGGGVQDVYVTAVAALSRYVDIEEVWKLSMGGAGDGSGLGVGAMDEEVRELLLRPRGKTVVQAVDSLKTGGDVMRQPLEKGIASMDLDFGGGTVNDDEEDWAEAAAAAKRAKQLTGGRGGKEVVDTAGGEGGGAGSEGGGGGGGGGGLEYVGALKWLEESVDWASPRVLGHIRLAEVNITAEEQGMLAELYRCITVEDARGGISTSDVNTAITANRLSSICDTHRVKASVVDRERRESARREHEVMRRGGRDAWVVIVKAHCGDSALWSYSEKLHGPLFVHADRARTQAWRIDGKETGGRTRRRMKKNGRPKQYTSRAVYDSGSESAGGGLHLPEAAKSALRPAAFNRLESGEEDAAGGAARQGSVLNKEASAMSVPEDFELLEGDDTDDVQIPAGADAKDEVPSVWGAQLVTAAAVCGGRLEVTSQTIVFIPDTEGPPGGHRDEAEKLERLRSKGRKVWTTASLKEVHGRRYLQRKSGLEFFFDAGRTVFFNFPAQRGDIKEVYKALVTRGGTRRKGNLRRAYLFDGEKEMARSSLTEDWVNRRVTNFEYLMQLNTLAGRSYNDLTQYPVMPWVLADYASTSIDLSNPSVYRDLSKPIGAQTEEKREKLRERFENFIDDTIPPFHYGTHYSTCGYVMWYLIRTEPFSASAVNLQGGRFDCPDRLFWSVGDAFKNCTTTMNDVKELTPEWFYAPDFLLNQNKFELGETQSRGRVDDVVLPPWCGGSASEFTRINMQALESEHVSNNIHNWIDLIFGYKQKGQAAADASNVFYFLTYEGAVDMDAIEDEVVRESMEAQIADYGQTPHQLFNRPHPQRKPSGSIMKPVFYNPDLFSTPLATSAFQGDHGRGEWGRFVSDPQLEQHGNKFGSIAAFNVIKVSDFQESVAFLSWCGDKTVISVSSFGELRTWLWDGKESKGGKPFNMSMQEASLRIKITKGRSALQVAKGVAKSVKGLIQTGELTFERELNVGPAGRCFGGSWQSRFAVMKGRYGLSSNMIISAGHADGSVAAFSVKEGVPVLVQRVQMHRSAVTCIDVVTDPSGGPSFLVTGGTDGTCRIWDLTTPSGGGLTELGDQTTFKKLGKLPLSNHPRAILCGHLQGVTCVCGDASIGLVASASHDGHCVLSLLHRGTFVRKIPHPAKASIELLSLSREGLITMYSSVDKLLHVFDVNGLAVTSCKAVSSDGATLSVMTLVQDGLGLITGDTTGQITLRCARTLYPAHRFPQMLGNMSQPTNVLSLAMSPCGNYILAGLEDGRAEVLCDDGALLRKNQEYVLKELGIQLGT